ncbi:hypothetical protein ATANTOWER_017184 [Ataeniobius toweri]|uniref:Uncharacterized protein n=1 Tax=Ataeniobius toweri TaxID=208326 RepID=A0ABU7CH50_9TELE|nr:hypothetical protein [Ataeniobius toweri]
MGPVQGFPPVVLSPGVWGYPLPFPFPYPDFDYRLLYGLYPPGTYTTFSKEHKGTLELDSRRSSHMPLRGPKSEYDKDGELLRISQSFNKPFPRHLNVASFGL